MPEANICWNTLISHIQSANTEFHIRVLQKYLEINGSRLSDLIRFILCSLVIKDAG